MKVEMSIRANGTICFQTDGVRFYRKERDRRFVMIELYMKDTGCMVSFKVKESSMVQTTTFLKVNLRMVFLMDKDMRE